MNLVTKSELARIVGVSPQAVSEQIKKCHLRTVGEGRKAKIDLDDELVKEYINDSNDSRDRSRGVLEDSPKPKKQKSKTTVKKTEPKKEIVIKESQPRPYDDDELPDKNTLQRKKIHIDTKFREAMFHEKRNMLIPKDFISTVFSLLFSIDTSELHQLPAALAPEICSILGVDNPSGQIAVEKLLEKEIFSTMNRSQRAVLEKLQEYKIKIKEIA